MKRIAAPLVMLLILAASGATALALTSNAKEVPVNLNLTHACRGGNPLANVYHPYRLIVKKGCLTVTGTVASIRYEDDGDIHVNLRLPLSEAGLLNHANLANESGDLVTEIVPADQPGCTQGKAPLSPHGSYDFGICTGADLRTPTIGSQVSVTGPYVLDADHGWMEIHPVWAVTTKSASSTFPMKTSPTSTRATTTARCHASALASSDGYAGDYDVFIYSNQPYREATASDASDTWRHETNGSGYADIRLFHTAPGEAITVTVGNASCFVNA